MNEATRNILHMVQLRVSLTRSGQPITRDLLHQCLRETLVSMAGLLGQVDEQAMLLELETRYNVFVGKETLLENSQDHIAWLNSERKQNWLYWARYRQMMERTWAPASIQALEDTTDRVLSLLEDPRRTGTWDRRGLVVGHVQSGKTANYTGLICKAADAGYKIIIVLAGIHSNLRSQTQMRLDEGFLGYESSTPKELKRQFRPVGVGLIDRRPELRPDSGTNRLEKGDFKKTIAMHFNFHTNQESRPLLFVVKKNASVLKHLLDWVYWLAGRTVEQDVDAVVRGLPLLLIDDEADNASVDTRAGAFDELGKPNPEHDPTSINLCIRKLLMAFERRAYVGYTATPFANILIHEQGQTRGGGPDLFPSSFILNIPAPSNYAGPVRIFGLNQEPDESSSRSALGLVRHVADFEVPVADGRSRRGWMPSIHKTDHLPRYLDQACIPPSLMEAIMAFLLVCAARHVRHPHPTFNSMLIHVTRFTAVQHRVKEQVEQAVKELRQRLEYGEGALGTPLLDRLRSLWNTDFRPTSARVREALQDTSLTDLSFEQLQPFLLRIAQDIGVREINGTAGDALDYDQNQATGLNVIAVGGDKLARGLTLEGLSISYFLRASRMYDTLMQMGRWFGYRPGYLDLCRLYCTAELEQWYEQITDASEELRLEFDRMALAGGTPRDYGLRVLSHPSLMVTSSVKMRHGEKIQITYAGNISESVAFHRTAKELRHNWKALETLVGSLGIPLPNPVRRQIPNGPELTWKEAVIWQQVSADKIVSFFDNVITHPEASRSNASLLREYIKQMVELGELIHWTVALIPGTGGIFSLNERNISLVRRSPREERKDRFSIRRLLSPKDECIDLESDELSAAWQDTRSEYHKNRSANPQAATSEPSFPAGVFVRPVRSPQRGLLLLYPLSFQDESGTMLVDEAIPIVGFGVSFPGSKNARSVTYVVNNVYWEQELNGVSDV